MFHFEYSGVLVHDDLQFDLRNLRSNTHILIPFQVITVPVIVLNKRHVQLDPLGVPEFETAREEGHPRLCGRSQRHGTGDADGTEPSGRDVGVEEADHVIAR